MDGYTSKLPQSDLYRLARRVLSQGISLTVDCDEKVTRQIAGVTIQQRLDELCLPWTAEDARLSTTRKPPTTTKRSYSNGFPEAVCSSSTVGEAGDHWGTRRYAASIEWRRELPSHRGWYRVSLVQTLLREFRSLFFRIRELRRTQSDPRGVLIDPWYRAPVEPSVRQHAIDCGSQDRRNLCRHHPHRTPVDFELLAAAWALGGCWISGSMGNEPVA